MAPIITPYMKLGMVGGATLCVMGSGRFLNLSQNPLYDGALFCSLITISRLVSQTFTPLNQWQEEFIPLYLKGVKFFKTSHDLTEEEKVKFCLLGLKLILVVTIEVVIEKNIMNYLGSPISYSGFAGACFIGNWVVRKIEGQNILPQEELLEAY